ncbi:gas vesicle protein GvpO [Nocardia rhamnosiphila]|uniref:Gas vesicle protein GvpO n=1 Tax=Nocardia rhamnosiphila TaxID=426716 RepID=A0ABV2WLZ5_9NOCA|nr:MULTISPECIES: gas vesicle protein GvpO [Nocardia]MCX0273337.1 gas vesicle protein [Nocardia zapadnayensis]
MSRRSTTDDAADVDPEPDHPLTAREAAAAAIEHLRELTSKSVEGVTSMEPLDDGRLVEIEVLEDHRIPSSADMLALYEVEIDFDGNLLAYRRTARYARGSTEIGGRGRR